MLEAVLSHQLLHIFTEICSGQTDRQTDNKLATDRCAYKKNEMKTNEDRCVQVLENGSFLYHQSYAVCTSSVLHLALVVVFWLIVILKVLSFSDDAS